MFGKTLAILSSGSGLEERGDCSGIISRAPRLTVLRPKKRIERGFQKEV